MSLSLVRTRFSAIAAKIETTPGTDSIAGSPVAGDFILGSAQARFGPNVVTDPSFSGALDELPGIVGSLSPTIELMVPMRGSGTAGTAPSWGRLMRACTFEEVTDAVGVVATAATAGTTNSATFPVAFSSVANIYRGIPGILTGNPAAGAVSPIMGWTTGRVASFGETFGTALSTTTLMQIPPNVLYRPTSDEAVYKTVTLYLYSDGLLWIFTGCVGSVKLDLEAGGIGMLAFSLRGQFVSVTTVALPAALNASTATTPPRWVGGRANLLGNTAKLKNLSVDAGVGTVLPDNPEAQDGFDPAVPITRGVTATLNPSMDTTGQVALFNNFRNGTGGSLFAVVPGNAGNRFSVSMPAVRLLAADPGDRGGLRTNEIRAEANITDASFFLCQY